MDIRLTPKRFGLVFLAIALLLSSASMAQAVNPLAEDGHFNDWLGRENISDNMNDGPDGADIHYFYWGTNNGEANLYFMIERYDLDNNNNNKSVTYQIYIDTNNNGNYNNSVDRKVMIDYKPQGNDSRVQVEVFRPNGTRLSSRDGDWGESVHDGQLKVETKVAFSTLGIIAHQTIRMYVTSSDQNGDDDDDEDHGDRAPNAGDIQLSPIPVLGYPLLIAVVASVVFVVWWRRGRFMWKNS